jgi:hypothetical protein
MDKVVNRIFNKITLLLFAALMGLTSCSGVKEQLGVGRHSPDEFTVVKRAPLTLPPDYALRAPAEGSVPPAAASAARAKTVLMGEAAAQEKKGTSEEALLERMGVSGADPDIRTVINRENGYIALENKAVADKLIFWKDDQNAADAPASVVDPKAEADRLRKNQEEGKPVNAGDVPVIEKKQSTIDKLF